MFPTMKGIEYNTEISCIREISVNIEKIHSKCILTEKSTDNFYFVRLMCKCNIVVC